jgi:glucose/arabinose dehydrogenase
MKMKIISRYLKICLLLVPMTPVMAPAAFAQAQAYSGVTASINRFQENCAVCHGENLEGSAQGVPLRGELLHGESMAELTASIGNGYVDSGMPAWRDTFDSADIRSIALFILESRANVDYATSNFDMPLTIPDAKIESELHDFRLETVATDLEPLPFSIEPLPDGRLLLVEKTRGVSIIDLNGEQSELIQDTPRAYDDIYRLDTRLDIERGMGWLFDIVLHPNYQENGWVYLYFSDRCEDCNDISRERDRAVSMNKLVRGKIEDGRWTDQETIWEADKQHYGPSGDVGAGGRVAIDNAGRVYFTVGMKGGSNSRGIQDLSTPWGKIHRVNDDGSIPQDNPYADRDDVYRSIYTYGHRSPQGLEFDNVNRELWGTEHGPRGGDEVNRLLPGRNYGWPLYSLGMDYDGTEVEYGKELGIAFELSDIEQPVADLTPSPAVSSFIISTSEQFPQWQGDFLVGSLKARSLFRIDIENNRLVSRETLFEGLGRIRDIEQGFNGEIYLLLEHTAGGKIVRLVPAD